MTDKSKTILTYMQEHKTEKNNRFDIVDLLNTGVSADEIDKCTDELSTLGYIEKDEKYIRTIYSIS